MHHLQVVRLFYQSRMPVRMQSISTYVRLKVLKEYLYQVINIESMLQIVLE